jgi:hypothetical protein
MQSPTDFTVVYVITSDGKDSFADMALVSMLSVRISNPGLRIVALCDADSAAALRKAKHRLLEVCGEMISIETPEGEPTFRNRWIKTQLPKFQPGPCLYLDADTLVRSSLNDLAAVSADFSAVANHNGATANEQIWQADADVLIQMHWPVVYDVYLNGGVFFYRATEACRQIFELWHALWLEGLRATARLRDQPSLNTGLSRSHRVIAQLPAEYNFQLNMHDGDASNAVVWHFYKGTHTKPTIFEELVHLASRESLAVFRMRIRRIMDMPFPWPNTDFVARKLARRISGKRLPTTAEFLWLTGSRRAASRTALSDLKARVVKSRGRPR